MQTYYHTLVYRVVRRNQQSSSILQIEQSKSDRLSISVRNQHAIYTSTSYISKSWSKAIRGKRHDSGPRGLRHKFVSIPNQSPCRNTIRHSNSTETIWDKVSQFPFSISQRFHYLSLMNFFYINVQHFKGLLYLFSNLSRNHLGS